MDAQAASLIGLWRLVGFDIEYQDTGEKKATYGERPRGYLALLAQGRMIAIITAEERKVPVTDADCAAALRSMLAYSSMYRVEGDKWITKVDVAWHEAWMEKGLLACYVPPERFHLLQGENDLTLYQFNQNIAKHFFCKHCGIHTFGNPRSNPSSYLVNARCLDDFDLGNATVKPFDGRNWEAAYQARLEGR